MADNLESQIEGLIENSTTVIQAKKGDIYPDTHTIGLAIALLEEAKKRVPNDNVLKTFNLQGPGVTWTSILTAMTAAGRAISDK